MPGWQGRAGSGLKPKCVTVELAVGMGLSECFRGKTTCVRASHCLIQPFFGHLWSQFLYLCSLGEVLPLCRSHWLGTSGITVGITWYLLGLRQGELEPSIFSQSLHPFLEGCNGTGRGTQVGWTEVTQGLNLAGAGCSSLYGGILLPLFPPSPKPSPVRCREEESAGLATSKRVYH